MEITIARQQCCRRILLLLLMATLFMRAESTKSKSTKRREMFRESAVIDKIFKGYNKYVRPVKMYNESVRVVLDPALYGIYEVVNVFEYTDHFKTNPYSWKHNCNNEAQETITFSQWYRANWQDQFLTWNPEEFGGIEMIKPPAQMIWIPDLTLYGMIEVTGTLSDEQLCVHLNYTGHVLFSIGQNIRVHCTYDVSRFPFDKQRCVLHYTSWMFHDGELSLYPMNAKGVDDYFQRNTEWRLESFTGERKIFTYDEGTYSEVFYYIDIQRKPLYYMLTIVVPSFAITTLSLIGLFSPFNHSGDRQEKVTMGLTTLLTMAVLLLMVSTEMPKTSDGMPLLGLFIMFELLISSLATFVAVLIMYLHRSGSQKRRPPKWLLCILLVRDETDADDGGEESNNNSNGMTSDFKKNKNRRDSTFSNNHQKPNSNAYIPVYNNPSYVNGGRTESHYAVPNLFIRRDFHCNPFNDVKHTTECMDRRVSSMNSHPGLNNNYQPLSPKSQKKVETELIRICLDNLRDMTILLRDWKSQNERGTLWTKVCDRVDMILVVLFFLLHAFTAAYFFFIR